MERHLAVIIGGIVVILLRGILGEGKLNMVISIIVGVIVAFILYFIL